MPCKLARSYFLAAWHQSIRFVRRLHVPSLFRIMFRWICLSELPTSLDHHFQPVADLASCVTPLLKRLQSSTGILNLLPITYAFRPRLRGRLTLGGRTLPRKPWVYGDTDSNRVYRYLCLHSHFQPLHGHLPFPLRCCWNAFLPLQPRRSEAHSFGILLESRSFSARIRSMGQLLRTV